MQRGCTCPVHRDAREVVHARDLLCFFTATGWTALRRRASPMHAVSRGMSDDEGHPARAPGKAEWYSGASLASCAHSRHASDR